MDIYSFINKKKDKVKCRYCNKHLVISIINPSTHSVLKTAQRKNSTKMDQTRMNDERVFQN